MLTNILTVSPPNLQSPQVMCEMLTLVNSCIVGYGSLGKSQSIHQLCDDNAD